MFVERKVCCSALFTNLFGWHAGAASFPLSDIILAQLACPLSDVMFCLHSQQLTYLSTNIGVRVDGYDDDKHAGLFHVSDDCTDEKFYKTGP